jgi:O6-methylguanine-DNA--protein-cysteine methyltransferase
LNNDPMPHTLTIETRQTPLGDLMLVTGPDGRLRATEFADCKDRLHHLLGRKLGAASYRLVQGSAPTAIAQAVDRYFAGDLGAIRNMPIHNGGTLFQEAVWGALHRIEPGRPVNYAAWPSRSASLTGRAPSVMPMAAIRTVSSCPVIASSVPTAISPATAAAWSESVGCSTTKPSTRAPERWPERAIAGADAPSAIIGPPEACVHPPLSKPVPRRIGSP